MSESSSLRRTPTINFDILTNVIDLLADEGNQKARATIMALSRTCRYLRLESVRRLFSRSVRVNVVNQPHLVAPFCHFMLGDPGLRFPLLHRLTIDVDHLAEDVAQLFSRVLAQSCRLEYFQIDSLLDLEPHVVAIISSAIAALTSLKHLIVGHCSSNPHRSCDRIFYGAMQNICSPLISIRVYMPTFELPDERILYVRNQDPIFLLSKLTGSLRSVHMGGQITVGGGIRVYPLVEELQVSCYLNGMPDLRTYMICFPNARHLRCGFSNNSWVRHRHSDDIFREGCCFATVQEWHDYNKRDSDRHARAWPMLRSFQGSIIDAYVLSLPCRVSRLHMLSTGGERSMEYAMLSTILSQTQPSSLRLCLKVYETRGYIPILPPQSLWAGYLTELEVRFNIVKPFFDLDECFVSQAPRSV